MPYLAAQFNSSGPLIDVWLAVSAPKQRALRALGLEPPPALKLQFIIDTGADTTMVADQHMRSLGIDARGRDRSSLQHPRPRREPATAMTFN